MNRDKDWRETVINIVLIGASVIGGCYALGYLITGIGDHIVIPLIHAIKVYFAAYGRVTAEVFTLAMVAGFSYRYHTVTTIRVVMRFIKQLQRLEKKLEKSTSRANDREKESLKLRHEVEALSNKVRDRDASILSLRTEKSALQDELEHLKTPEAAARKNAIEEKKVHDASLKEIAASIRWGAV